MNAISVRCRRRSDTCYGRVPGVSSASVGSVGSSSESTPAIARFARGTSTPSGISTRAGAPPVRAPAPRDPPVEVPDRPIEAAGGNDLLADRERLDQALRLELAPA